MLKILATLARVAFGFVLASLTAGLVTVLFVNTPTELVAQPASEYAASASDTLDLALMTATHASIFAAAFVLIAAGLGEWFSIRSLPFYLVTGSVIALLGFAAQFSSEVAGQPTILNNYAVTAFVTAGFFAGFVYWLASGQFSGVAAGRAAGSEQVIIAPKIRRPVSERTPVRGNLSERQPPASKVVASENEPPSAGKPQRDPLTAVRAGGARLMSRLAKVQADATARAKSSVARVTQIQLKRPATTVEKTKVEAKVEKPTVKTERPPEKKADGSDEA